MNSVAGHIRYVPREEIDLFKWDDCIAQSQNSLIYARSFYLDAMSQNWSALIYGDYEAVMPLTWKKKYGFHYLYQPYFTKTLGVFGIHKPSYEISAFLEAVPKKFSYWEIDLNENNRIETASRSLSLELHARNNYFLSLHRSYEEISKQYKRLASRMTKKAAGFGLEVVRHVDPASIIGLYQRDYGHRNRDITEGIYKRLLNGVQTAYANKQAETYLARSAQGEIIAYYIILSDARFIYSLMGGSTKEGKQAGAFYLLTDTVIRDHAGIDKIFRFEGSDRPGISFFDSLFGPTAVSYQHLKMNNLPFPINLLK